MAKLGRAQIGWLGELATDETNVVGSGGRLIPYIPLIDAHGVDRAYCWNGVGPPNFTQIKTSGFADDEGRHRWELRVGSFAAYPRFSVVLNIIDPRSGRVGDVVWRLDSTLVRRLARLEYDSARRTEVYRLDGSPTHHDRLAPYRHTRDVLWKEFAPGVRLGVAAVEKLPVLRIDQGGVFEFAMFTELMRANHKDLLLFRPRLISRAGISLSSLSIPPLPSLCKSRARLCSGAKTWSASTCVATRLCLPTTSGSPSISGRRAAGRCSRSAGWCHRASWLGGRPISGMPITSASTPVSIARSMGGPTAGIRFRIRRMSSGEPCASSAPRRSVAA